VVLVVAEVAAKGQLLLEAREHQGRVITEAREGQVFPAAVAVPVKLEETTPGAQ
jgi:hypothetical protein